MRWRRTLAKETIVEAKGEMGLNEAALLLGRDFDEGWLFLDGERLLYCSRSRVAALARKSGHVQWCVDHGHVPALGAVLAKDRIVVATLDGTLDGYDTVSGRGVWRRVLSRPMGSDISLQPGGRVIGATMGRHVYVLAASTGDVVSCTRVGNLSPSSFTVQGGVAYYGTTDGALLAVEMR